MHLTLCAGSNDGLQDLLVVEDEDEALGGANDQRRSNIQAGGPAKVALADLGEDLARDDLQLRPAHNLPWWLRCICFVGLLLEEQVAGQRRLTRVHGQEGRRCPARGCKGRGRQARGEAALEGLEGRAVGARRVVRVGDAAAGRGDDGALNRRGIIGGGCRFEARPSASLWSRGQLSGALTSIVSVLWSLLGLAAARAGKGQAIGAAVDRLELLSVFVLLLRTARRPLGLGALDCRPVLDAIASVYRVVGVIVSADVAQPRF